MKNQEEKASLCAMGKIFGFEPKIANALIAEMGSARKVFELKENELNELLGPFSKYKGQLTHDALEKASRELEALEEKGIAYCGITEEEEYPAILKECADPPVGIYIRSDTPAGKLWIPERKIAIVGTRDISPYGREWCEKTVAALGSIPEKPLIISGLALGTDICAHRAALSVGLPTIGVMATGPDSIYPYRNQQTAIEMTRTPGCALITDYPPGTAPLAIHFLRRNRIIAGLSHATILIESKIRGGGMMTSRLAFSYSRDVFALPGRVDDIRSQGCNELIRAKIAEPLTSIKDMLDSMGMKTGSLVRRHDFRDILKNVYCGLLSEDKIADMAVILTHIRKERGITVDELASTTGFSFRHTINLCNMMESDSIITIDLLQRCSINTKSF